MVLFSRQNETKKKTLQKEDQIGTYFTPFEKKKEKHL
jgi:hypothetical protein